MKSNPMSLRLTGLLLLAWLPAAAPAQPAAATQPTVSSGFMRFIDDQAGGGRLETAIATYQNRQGVKVHLVGAVHVGEAGYYRTLCQTFATYDALLYELIKPANAAAPTSGQRTTSMVSMFQRFLKDVLGLRFQLDEIDYSAGNFIHADLDSDTFYRMQEQRGESLMTLMLRQMLSEMSKPQEMPEVTMAQFFVALASPDRARQFKLILGRQFQDIDEKVAAMEGPNGTVLVTERNKAALAVLTKTIATGKKNIGIFYGDAHMHDMEQRLLAMGFSRIDIQWRTAWDMTPHPGDVIFKFPTTRPQ